MFNKRALISSLAKPLTVLNRIIPKKSTKILFYSNLGFRDNMKAMFDYLIENNYNDKFKIICAVDDYEKYSDVNFKNVKFISHRKGVVHFFTSKLMFYSFGKYLIKPSKSQVVVNLWHGMPLKKIGNMVEGCENIDYDFFTHIIATSPFFKVILSKSFNCDDEKIILTGQPRCDKLFSGEQAVDKAIIWLPTFRSSKRLGATDFKNDFRLITKKSDWEILDYVLKDKGFRIIIKPHPLDDFDIELPKLSSISILPQNELESSGQDIYDLLKTSSAMITDFSSIYFDYLMLDRPIGFTVEDIGEYSENRGFVIDNPEIIMPGDKIDSFDKLLTFVNNVIEGIDSHRESREKVNKLVNQSFVKQSAEHILKTIGI